MLIVTARDAIADRVKGLDAGADDYLVKPFDLDELGARMRALIRRHAGRGESLVRHGELALDPVGHQVTLAGNPVALSAREFALLEALMARPGAVLSKSQLEEKIYGWGEEIGSNTVEVYIHSLRKKLGADLIPKCAASATWSPRTPDAVDPPAIAHLWLLALVIVGVGFAGWLIYRQALAGANELFDYQLQQIAAALPSEPFSSVLSSRSESDEVVVIQIWNRNGVLMYYSHPRVLLALHAELGFSTEMTPRGEWRV